MAETQQISPPMEVTLQAPHPLEETPQIPPSIEPQRTAPVEASQQEKPAGKRRRGRRKIPMQRIHDDTNRMITFSKRRAGIYKKTMEISTLCGVDVGILIFSPAGKLYAYGVPNIESIADKFLRGVNPDAHNENVSRIVKEAQRRARVGKLNKDCDELFAYFQNLKQEGEKLKELKKQTFDEDYWWDIPVEDLNADDMQRMTMTMEEIKKNATRRLMDLRASASSSTAVAQPDDTLMEGNEGFGYVSSGGFGDFTGGGSSSAVAGVQGVVMQMGGNLGQGYRNGVGSSGGFRDLMAAGIQGGGSQQDGNGGLGGFRSGIGGLGNWGASSSCQAGGMQMIGNGGGVAGSLGDFTAGGSSSMSVQQGSMQVGGYGEGGFGGNDVVGGGICKWRPVGSAAAYSPVPPGVGSMLVDGNGGGGYGGGVGGGGGGLSDGWKPVKSSSTFTAIHGANPMHIVGGGGSGLGDWGMVGPLSMQMGGNGVFGYKDGVGGSSAGSGHGDWRAFKPSTMQIGGIGGYGYNDNARGAGGRLGGWGAGGASSPSSLLQPNPMQMGGNGLLDPGSLGGGAGGVFGGDSGRFGDFTAGGWSSVALQPDQGQMGGTSYGGSFYDGGGGFGTNNGFDDFLCDGGSNSDWV